jgi:hypothetical protein
MKPIGTAPGIVGLCTALAVPLIVIARNETRMGQAQAPTAQTQTVPPSLPMGGAKSVTRRELDIGSRGTRAGRPPRPRGSGGRCDLVEFSACVTGMQPGRPGQHGGAGLFYCFAVD